MSSNVSLNNIISLTRGDTFKSPLFINAGTATKPIRYHLKDGRELKYNSSLVVNSILAKDSTIKVGSEVNGVSYNADTTITSPIVITESSTLMKGSIIHETSIIKTGSILDNEIITEDLTIAADQVYLGVMEPNQSFECAIIKKTFTSKNENEYGDVLIKLTPEDTVCLTPGKYFYQVKTKLVNDEGSYDVNTIVDKTPIYIVE